MGRGLSDLQKTVLQVAYRNLPARLKMSGVPAEVMAAAAMLGGPKPKPQTRENSGADVYYHEILEAAYGWKPRYRARINIASPRFSKAEIGEKNYAAAMSAVSRAVVRLAQRGLVHAVQGARSHWSGATLTEAGIKLAESLSVNTESVSTKS